MSLPTKITTSIPSRCYLTAGITLDGTDIFPMPWTRWTTEVATDWFKPQIEAARSGGHNLIRATERQRQVDLGETEACLGLTESSRPVRAMH